MDLETLPLNSPSLGPLSKRTSNGPTMKLSHPKLGQSQLQERHFEDDAAPWVEKSSWAETYLVETAEHCAAHGAFLEEIALAVISEAVAEEADAEELEEHHAVVQQHRPSSSGLHC